MPKRRKRSTDSDADSAAGFESPDPVEDSTCDESENSGDEAEDEQTVETDKTTLEESSSGTPRRCPEYTIIND